MISGNWRRGDGFLALDRITPRQAFVVLTAVAALVAFGLVLALTTPPAGPRPGGGSDARLYEAVIRDVARGEAYHTAAAREHRLAGAPLHPFVAVRPPLLAEGLATLPGRPVRAGALVALAAATWAAWAWRLRGLRREPVRYAWALALLSSGVSLALGGGAYLFHEEWAGLLIALSLALRTPRHWLLSVAVGLVAAVLRELAFPYLAAMAFLALMERRRIEAAVWSGALLVAALTLAAHAAAVAAVTTPSDLVSPGWTRLGGWGFILHLSQFNCFLLEAPLWIPAILLPFALLGAAFWSIDETGLGRRAAVISLGYACAFCIVGRADNDYWSLMIAPLWPLGLTQADRVVAILLAACRRLPLGRSAAARRA